MSRLETFVDAAFLVALARRIISGDEIPANSGSEIPANSGDEIPANSGDEIPANSGDEIPANSGSEIPTNITGLAGAVPAFPQSS